MSGHLAAHHLRCSFSLHSLCHGRPWNAGQGVVWWAQHSTMHACMHACMDRGAPRKRAWLLRRLPSYGHRGHMWLPPSCLHRMQALLDADVPQAAWRCSWHTAPRLTLLSRLRAAWCALHGLGWGGNGWTDAWMHGCGHCIASQASQPAGWAGPQTMRSVEAGLLARCMQVGFF